MSNLQPRRHHLVPLRRPEGLALDRRLLGMVVSVLAPVLALVPALHQTPAAATLAPHQMQMAAAPRRAPTRHGRLAILASSERVSLRGLLTKR